MSELPASAEDIVQLLEERLAKRQYERLASMPERAVAWLAMSPGWPRSLAEAAFPRDAGPDILLAQGFAELQPGEPPWREPWLVMNAGERAGSVAELARRHGDGGDYFHAELREAALAMRSAAEGRPLPAPVERWMSFAQTDSPEAMAWALDDAVGAAIRRAQERRTVACPDAVRWIETAEPLSAVLGGPLEVAVVRARRRLELFHRRSRDERLLGNYVERAEHERAFRDLVEGAKEGERGPAWALHFIGQGGAGKTMLMRRITTSLARELRLTTARIDFDNLNPNYPARSPGLLLMSLAEELRLSDDTSAATYFSRFDHDIRALHQKLESAYRTGSLQATGGVNRLDRQYLEAERAFADGLRIIARSSVPVLILDTCEELARARGANDLPDALLRTFEILERLNAAVPSLRVVMSGRRMLAGAGDGWNLPESSLPARPYLRLFELRGFDEDESERFLRDFRRDGRTVPPDLHGLIREQSPDRATSILAGVRWSGETPRADAGRRHNPFDLNLLASLACREPPPTGEELAKGRETYIHERILGRLSPETRAIMVDLALLGRFDRGLLEELTGLRGAAFDPLWDDIRAQEWSDPDNTARAGAEIWGMDAQLRDRVLGFFRGTGDDGRPGAAADWAAARRRLAGVLARVTQGRPWHFLVPSYFVVALDVLADDPEAAARWWAEVEARIAREGAWDWAQNVTAQLLVEEDPAGISCSGLRAAVLATRAAAMLRKAPEELNGIWRQVLADCGRHPLPEMRGRLRHRAMAGLLAELRFRPDSVDEEDAEQHRHSIETLPVLTEIWRSAPDRQILATELAMLDSLAEVLGRIPWRRPVPSDLLAALNHRAEELVAHSPPGLLSACAALIAARFRSMETQAEVMPPASPDTADDGDAFLDWIKPERPAARLRLEWNLLARWKLPRRFEGGMPGSLDEDRDLALRLMVASDWSLEGARVPEEQIEASISLAGQPTERLAHILLRPFFSVALRLQAELGDPEAAARQLQSIAEDRRLRLEARREAARDALRIIIRHRLDGSRFNAEVLLSESASLADAVLQAEINAFGAGRDQEKAFGGRWHEGMAWLAARGRKVGLKAELSPTASFAKISLALDELEGEEGGAEAAREGAASWFPEWEARHPRAEVQRVILRERLNLLVQPLQPPFGPRRHGDILFCEGSLLSLRGHARAGGMLERAAWLYREAGDMRGFARAMVAAGLAWVAAGLTEEAQGALRMATGDDVPAPGGGWPQRLRALEWLAQGPAPGPRALPSELADLTRDGMPGDLVLPIGRASGAVMPRRIASAARQSATSGYVVKAFLLLPRIVGGAAALLGLWFVVSFDLIVAVTRVLGLLGLSAALLLAYVWLLTRGIIARIEPDAAVPDPNEPLRTGRIRLTLSASLPFLGFKQTMNSNLMGPVDSDDYASQRVVFGVPVSERFSRWFLPAVSLIRRYITVVLEVDPRLAAPCWEALLRPHVAVPEWRWSKLYELRRTGIAPPAPLSRRINGPMRISVLGFPRAGQQRAWITATRNAGALLRFGGFLGELRERPPNIVHACCDAVEGSTGLELRVSQTAFQSEITSADEAYDAGEAVAPALLAGGGAGPPLLFILQGAALQEAHRSASDRYASGLMRRAAAELHDAGVPAVLVIPPLPEATALAATRIVAAAVASGPKHGMAALQQAIREIRDVIVAVTDPEVAAELAFDLCLYGVEQLDLTAGKE